MMGDEQIKQYEAITYDTVIVKGQEAICPDGLGRVMGWDFKCPENYIQVSTYIDDRQCKWSPDNVMLVPIRKE